MTPLFGTILENGAVTGGAAERSEVARGSEIPSPDDKASPHTHQEPCKNAFFKSKYAKTPRADFEQHSRCLTVVSDLARGDRRAAGASQETRALRA